jgi:hypothetical protein
MRTIALGMLAAIGIAMAVPANADEVRVGVGPVGVSVGDHDHHDRAWRHRHERITVGAAHRDCKTVIIHKEGMTKKIRRCD